jgi:methyl-accepting chemotaxis protein
VVAHEVKQLAGQASGATEQIRSLAGMVAGGATVAHDALAEIAATAATVAGAAEAIRLEVDRRLTGTPSASLARPMGPPL